MDALLTWFKLILSYFVPWIAPVLFGLGLCGCAPKYIDYQMYGDPGHPREATVYRFPGKELGMAAGDVFVPDPPGNAEVSLKSFYENGAPKLEYTRSRAATIDAWMVAALQSGDQNMAMYAQQMMFLNQLLDRLDSKLDPLLGLLQQRLSYMVTAANTPGTPANNTQDAANRWIATFGPHLQQMYEYLKKQPGFPGQAQPVQP